MPLSEAYNDCFIYGAFTSDPREAKGAGSGLGPLEFGQLLSGSLSAQQTLTYVVDSREDADFSLAVHGSHPTNRPCAVTDLLPQLQPLSATADSLGRVNAPAERQLVRVEDRYSFANPRILVDGIGHGDRFYLRDISRRSSLQAEAGSNPGAMAERAALETLIHRFASASGMGAELASSLFNPNSGEDTGLIEGMPSFALSAAFDAHANLAIVYDELYKLGLNSYDGEGGSVLAIVHRPIRGIIAGDSSASAIDNILIFDQAGSYRPPNFCNAGVQNGNSWQYQNSYASVLNVVAHEFGHSITGAHSNLVYAAESGALNEGFSDWLGVAVNALAKNQTSWEIGGGRVVATADLFCRIPAFRNIEYPSRHGDPDLHQGERWRSVENCQPEEGNDNCYVHTNSGVPNHAFYRMVSGLPQSEPDKRGIEPFAGMALTRAISIGLYANRFLWDKDESLASGADDMVLAAYMLYGQKGGQEVIATERAWGYVGLPPVLDHEVLSVPEGGVAISLSATVSVAVSGMAVSTLDVVADAGGGLLASVRLCWQLEPSGTEEGRGEEGPELSWSLEAPDGTQVAQGLRARPADCFSTAVDPGLQSQGPWSFAIAGPVAQGSILSWTLSLNFEPPRPQLQIDALDVFHPELPFLRVDDPVEFVAWVVNRRQSVWDPAGHEDGGFYVSFTLDGRPVCKSEIYARSIAAGDRPALRCTHRQLIAGPQRVQAEIVRQRRAPYEGQLAPAAGLAAQTFNWRDRLRPDLALVTDTLIAWSHRVIGEPTALGVGLTNVGEAPWEQTESAPGRFRLAFLIEGETLCHSAWHEGSLAVDQSRSFFCAASWSPAAAVTMPQDYRVRAQIQWEPNVFATREGPPAAPRQGNNSVSKVFRWLLESPLSAGGAAPFIAPPADVRVAVPERNFRFPFFLSFAALGPPALLVDDSMQLVDATFSPDFVERLGSHDILWTARDSNGNSATATQRLQLVDETPPELFFRPCSWSADRHLVGELPLEVLCHLSLQDNVDRPEDLEIGIAPRSFSRPGTHTLGLRARDLSGNETSITGTFIIIDLEPPTIIASSTIFVRGPTPLRLTPALLGSPRALDNADPSPTLTVVDPRQLKLSLGGTYTLELQANAFGLPGAAHNTRAVLTIVYQVPGEPPVIRAPPDRVHEPRQLPLTGARLLEVLLGAAAVTAFDFPDITESLTADRVIDGTGPLQLDFREKEITGLGTAAITWTAEDSDGNRVEVLQLIHLVDRSAPTLRMAPDQMAEFRVEKLPLFLDEALADGRLRGPIAEDNLDAKPELSLRPSTITRFGVQTLAWRATDASGNSSATLTQAINFIDGTPQPPRPDGGSIRDGSPSTGALARSTLVWLALLLFGQDFCRGLRRTLVPLTRALNQPDLD